MSISITQQDVRVGDKLLVAWENKGVRKHREGIAHKKLGDLWVSPENGSLGTNIPGATITLLERAKTPEEILAERRDTLSRVFSPPGLKYEYRNLSHTSQRLVNHIIFLEDEKEALTK